MATNVPHIYETLVRLVLSEKILDVFEVANVMDEYTGQVQVTGFVLNIAPNQGILNFKVEIFCLFQL